MRASRVERRRGDAPRACTSSVPRTRRRSSSAARAARSSTSPSTSGPARRRTSAGTAPARRGIGTALYIPEGCAHGFQTLVAGHRRLLPDLVPVRPRGGVGRALGRPGVRHRVARAAAERRSATRDRAWPDYVPGRLRRTPQLVERADRRSRIDVDGARQPFLEGRRRRAIREVLAASRCLRRGSARPVDPGSPPNSASAARARRGPQASRRPRRSCAGRRSRCRSPRRPLRRRSTQVRRRRRRPRRTPSRLAGVRFRARGSRRRESSGQHRG